MALNVCASATAPKIATDSFTPAHKKNLIHVKYYLQHLQLLLTSLLTPVTALWMSRKK